MQRLDDRPGEREAEIGGEAVRFWLPLVVGVGLALRVMLLTLGPWEDAGRVAAGVEHSAYSQFLVMSHALGLSWRAVLAVQCGVSAATAGAVFIVVRGLTGGVWAGLMGAAMWAVHPEVVLAAVELQPATLTAGAWLGGLAMVVGAGWRAGGKPQAASSSDPSASISDDRRQTCEAGPAWGLWITGGVLLGAATLFGPVSAGVGLAAAGVLAAGYLGGAASARGRLIRIPAAAVLLLAVATPAAVWHLHTTTHDRGLANGGDPSVAMSTFKLTPPDQIATLTRDALLTPRVERLYAAAGLTGGDEASDDPVARILAQLWRVWSVLSVAAGGVGLGLLLVRRQRLAACVMVAAAGSLALTAGAGAGGVEGGSQGGAEAWAPLVIGLAAIAAGGVLVPRRPRRRSRLIAMWQRWRASQNGRRAQHAATAEAMVRRRFTYSPLAGTPELTDEPDPPPMNANTGDHHAATT